MLHPLSGTLSTTPRRRELMPEKLPPFYLLAISYMSASTSVQPLPIPTKTKMFTRHRIPYTKQKQKQINDRIKEQKKYED